MKNYAYRTKLTAEEMRDPLLRAAFAVAERAHRDQLRGKADRLPDGSRVPYITHPLMVMDILYEMGVRDSEMLAAALLHDVLEDCKKYRGKKNDPNDYHHKMHEDLLLELDRLIAKPMDAERSADRIFQLVKEVTKPKIYDEGTKLIAQIEEMQKASLEGKILKIADQIGSMMCRLHAADDPEVFTKDQQREFTKKSTNLVQAILEMARDDGEREVLKPWDSLFGWVRFYARKVDENITRSGEDEVRAHIDFKSFFTDKALNKGATIQLTYPPTADTWYADPLSPSVLRRVDFDAKGHIKSCVLKRGTSENSALHAMREKWIQEVDRVSKMIAYHGQTNVQVGEVERVSEDGTEEGRLFKLSPSLPAEPFAATCRGAHLCTFDESTEMTKQADLTHSTGLQTPQPVVFDVTRYKRRIQTPETIETVQIDRLPDAEGVSAVMIDQRGRVVGYRLWAKDSDHLQEMHERFEDRISIVSHAYHLDPEHFRQGRRQPDGTLKQPARYAYDASTGDYRWEDAYVQEPARRSMTAFADLPKDVSGGVEQSFYFGKESLHVWEFTARAKQDELLSKQQAEQVNIRGLQREPLYDIEASAYGR